MVCGKAVKDNLCECGFDFTNYYDGYRTLVKIDTKKVSAIKKRKNYDANLTQNAVKNYINQIDIKDSRIKELEQKNSRLEKRLQELEKRLDESIMDLVVQKKTNLNGNTANQNVIAQENKSVQKNNTVQSNDTVRGNNTVQSMSGVNQDSVELGLAYYSEKKYVSAFSCFKNAAENGNAEAMNYLGDLYYFGDGVYKSLDDAKMWYKNAADKGNVKAKDNLKKRFGIYDRTTVNNAATTKSTTQNVNGTQISYSNTLASKEITNGHKLWPTYQKAINGDATSQVEIGVAYRDGNGVKKDYQEANKWFQNAVSKGSVWAMAQLGYVYENGYGVSKDMNKAIEWYEKAGNGGNNWSMKHLGQLYSKKAATTYHLERDKNYEKAFLWIKKSAENGDKEAMNSLADAYYFGEGVSKNMTTAKEWYMKAADKGNELAKSNLKKRFGLKY